MTPQVVVLANVRLFPNGDPVDVVSSGGAIASVTPAGSGAAAARALGAADPRLLELGGRWIMPGLVDRHVHFTLWSRQRARLSIAGLPSAAAAAATISGAIAAEPGTRVFVARGYQDALWGDVPTAQLLDDAAADAGQAGRAIVVLSHDLHSVWINSAAGARFGAEPGFLTEGAAFALEVALEREEAADPVRVAELVGEAASAAAARGVTGILDLEMTDNPAVWAERARAGFRELRVSAGVYPQHLDAALARGERTGTVIDGSDGLVTVGPLKVFADGSLNTRTAWCFDAYPEGGEGEAAHDEGGLEALLARARDERYEVALHAIGDRAVASALDAFEATGARGSVEHAQLIRPEDTRRFAQLGIAAGVHPEHALDDRPVADTLWSGRTGNAFALKALADAGVELRMGSDAPVSPLDPWFGISAAVHRTRDDLPAWEPQNALTLEQAFAASWAMPRIEPGAPADMVVLDDDPRGLGHARLRTMAVAVTVTGGRITHLAV